ncbi:hypothetical protein A2U01_0033998, partial [Trifolium medium]|nr:hypothetical protein [Trifolium medium]
MVFLARIRRINVSCMNGYRNRCCVWRAGDSAAVQENVLACSLWVFILVPIELVVFLHFLCVVLSAALCSPSLSSHGCWWVRLEPVCLCGAAAP